MRNIIQWVKRARLRDWLRLIDRALPHVAIVLSGMLIVFFLIDRVNKPMAFMTNEFHKRITFVLAILSIYLAARRCAYLRAQERESWSRRPRPRTQQPQTSRRYADTPRASDDYPRRASAYPTRRAGYSARTQSDYEPGYTRRR